MDRKYNMIVEDNIFFAKRKLIDNLYKSANLEGIKVTFADTVDFVNNVNNGKLSVDDMLKMRGLKDAWEYILLTVNDDVDANYLKKVQFEICKGHGVSPLGEFRDRGVGIISIPVEKIGEYLSILINFYETGDYSNIKNWLYINALDGVE